MGLPPKPTQAVTVNKVSFVSIQPLTLTLSPGRGN